MTTEINDAQVNANVDALESDPMQAGGYDRDDATSAFMKKWEVPEDDDGENLSDPEGETDGPAQEEVPVKEDDESQDEGDATEGESGEDEDDDEGDESGTDDDGDEDQGNAVLSDDAKVTVSVNGEDKEFTVGNLKRLAGQEAALTQKSQAVAAQSKKYEEGLNIQSTALRAMIEKAEARYAPYKDIDFALAAKEYDAETYAAVKDEAIAAYRDLTYYSEELGRAVAAQSTHAHDRLVEEAQVAMKTLSDPETGIKGFNRELLGSMQKYTVEAGVDASVVGVLTDPTAWKIIHKAMAFDKLSEAAKPGTARPKKAGKTVTLKRSAPSGKGAQKRSSKDAITKLRSATGHDALDAATNAFLSKWGVDE